MPLVEGPAFGKAGKEYYRFCEGNLYTVNPGLCGANMQPFTWILLHTFHKGATGNIQVNIGRRLLLLLRRWRQSMWTTQTDVHRGSGASGRAEAEMQYRPISLLHQIMKYSKHNIQQNKQTKKRKLHFEGKAVNLLSKLVTRFRHKSLGISNEKHFWQYVT